MFDKKYDPSPKFKVPRPLSATDGLPRRRQREEQQEGEVEVGTGTGVIPTCGSDDPSMTPILPSPGPDNDTPHHALLRSVLRVSICYPFFPSERLLIEFA